MTIQRVLGLAIALMAVTAHAAPSMIRCTFGSCTAQIIQDDSLDVTCQGRAMYRGPYQLNTDFRTIQIESLSTNGPKIVTQALPCEFFDSKATLFIAGQQIDGVCQLTNE